MSHVQSVMITRVGCQLSQFDLTAASTQGRMLFKRHEFGPFLECPGCRTLQKNCRQLFHLPSIHALIQKLHRYVR
jgi:hypothetical protein